MLREVIEPGSVDLNVLHPRLMGLKFTWRGHDQGKPLALAYDWLYAHWATRSERAARQAGGGCDYLIEHP